MMKWLSLLLVFSGIARAGLPPTSVQGQSDATAQTKFNFQVPYNQKTDLGGIKSLLETGNKNLLLNASFEHVTYSTSWTITTASGSVDTTNVHDGKQSALITVSAQAGCITQDVTPTIQTGSTNLEYSIWTKVPTSMSAAGVQACARNAGATIGTCAKAPADGNWHLLLINYPGPSSGSVGISVCNTVSSTGTFNVDDAYIGSARNVGTVAQAQSIGTLFFTPATASCSWAITQTTYAADFSATSACPTATVTGSLTSPSKTPQAAYANAAPGTYLVTFSANTASAVGNPSCRIIDDLGNVLNEIAPSQPSGGQALVIPGVWTYTTAGNRTWKVQCLSSSGATTLFASTEFGTAGFNVMYFPSQSQLAVNSNAGPFFTNWTAYTPTFTNLGTVTNNAFFWRQVGDSIEIKGKATTGTPAAALVTMTLPSGLTGDTTKIEAATSSNLEATGKFEFGSLNASPPTTGTLLVTGGSNTVQFGARSSAAGALVPINGSTLIGTTVDFSIDSVTIPITGWTSPSMPVPVLIGSVTSTTTGQERIERATVGSTATPCTASPCPTVSQSSTFIPTNGVTRSSAGIYPVSFTAGEWSSAPSCPTSSMGSSSTTCMMQSVTTSGGTVFCTTGGTSTGADAGFTFICMGPR